MADIFELFRKIGKEEARGGGAPEWILAGLGNPGREYANTRHNTGFLILDAIAAKQGAKIDRARFRALTGDTVIAGKRVLLLKPQTFMNLSGESVREAAAFYHIPPEKILVIVDDISFPVGRMRLRESGSDGGHNGLKNIIYQLSSDRFPRIRVGVGGKPHPDYPLADFVLSPFDEEDLKTLSELSARVFDGVEKVLGGDAAGAMQLLNGK